MLSHLTDNLDLWRVGLTNTVLLTVLGVVFGFFVAIPIAAALALILMALTWRFWAFRLI